MNTMFPYGQYQHVGQKKNLLIKNLTDVQAPLLSGVLPGVPVLPVFQLIVSALLLSKHHHDDAL